MKKTIVLILAKRANAIILYQFSISSFHFYFFYTPKTNIIVSKKLFKKKKIILMENLFIHLIQNKKQISYWNEQVAFSFFSIWNNEFSINTVSNFWPKFFSFHVAVTYRKLLILFELCSYFISLFFSISSLLYFYFYLLKFLNRIFAFSQSL